MADLPVRSVPRAQGGSGPSRLTRGERRRSASSGGSHTVYRDVSAAIVEALADVPGIRGVVEHDGVNRVIPHAVIYFTPDWDGPSGHAVQVALAQGEPHIYVQQGAHQGGYFDEIAVDPINLQPGEEAIVATRL